MFECAFYEIVRFNAVECAVLVRLPDYIPPLGAVAAPVWSSSDGLGSMSEFVIVVPVSTGIFASISKHPTGHPDCSGLRAREGACDPPSIQVKGLRIIFRQQLQTSSVQC